MALTAQRWLFRQIRTLTLVLLVTFALGALTETSLVQASNCSNTSVPGLVPIDDLGTGTYLGYEGGLYPNGSNTLPASHLSDGLQLAKQITPRNATGSPDQNGKIVLVTIGMSNTNIESQGLIQLSKNDTTLNPSLVIVDGAEGGVDARSIVTNPAPYWSFVDTQLSNQHVTPQQVQAAWLKEADASPSGSQTVYAATLMSQEITILQMMLQQFPNLKLVYDSSRIYAGYASTTLNPEPYAYSSGFSVKWLVEEQLNGTSSLNYNPSRGQVVAPFVDWGPYMWANGLTARSDGLTWQCSDFQTDGTHPSIPQGQMKVGNILLTFFKSDPTTIPWFTKPGGIAVSISAPSRVLAGTTVEVNVTVSDSGQAITTNVTLTARGAIVGSRTLTVPPAVTVTFAWTATGSAGPVSLTASASNNTATSTTNVWPTSYFELDWADWNNDGKVTILDAAQLAFCFDSTANSTNWSTCKYWDLFQQNKITIVDAATVAFHFDQTFGSTPYPGQGFAPGHLDSFWKGVCTLLPQPDKNYCQATS